MKFGLHFTRDPKKCTRLLVVRLYLFQVCREVLCTLEEQYSTLYIRSTVQFSKHYEHIKVQCILGAQ